MKKIYIVKVEKEILLVNIVYKCWRIEYVYIICPHISVWFEIKLSSFLTTYTKYY